jgi:release factor glutamine methyltransferase
VTIAELLAEGRRRLAASGVETAHLDSRLLAGHVLAMSREALLRDAAETVSAESRAAFDAVLSRRLAGEPVSRIIGRREFWGLPFEVTGDVLDPRADTEILVGAVLDCVSRDFSGTILDLGTGSGCIPVALLSELANARAIAVDIDEDALACARRNAETNNVADRLALRTGDWLSGIDGRVDIVTSNPPYIRSADIAGLEVEVRDHDPLLALDGGADGLGAYRKIIGGLNRILNPQGAVFLEIGADQANDVSGLLESAGFREIQVLSDLAGRDRCIAAMTLQARGQNLFGIGGFPD